MSINQRKKNKCRHYWDVDSTSDGNHCPLKEAKIYCISCGKKKVVKLDSALWKKIEQRTIKENLKKELTFNKGA